MATAQTTVEKGEAVAASSARTLGNVERVRRSYEASAVGDLPTLLAMLDGEVEWNMAEHHIFWPGGPFIGPNEVLNGVFAQIMRTFDGFTVTVTRILGFGDSVLAEIRYRGTARATGELLDAQAAHVFDFVDGRCVHYQQYTDTWQFAQVTGLSPISG